MDNLSIYVTYHNPEQITQYHLNTLSKPFILYDANKQLTGDTINHLNPVFSEMVTMYYVWKQHLYSPLIGFNHYRRIMKNVDTDRINDNTCQIYATINTNIYEHYCGCHRKEDIDIMLEILADIYGNDNQYTKHIKEGTQEFIINCCFVMTWGNFNELCNFMFPVLLEWDKRTYMNMSLARYKERYNDNTYQTRVQSFLAERLISAWIHSHLSYYRS